VECWRTHHECPHFHIGYKVKSMGQTMLIALETYCNTNCLFSVIDDGSPTAEIHYTRSQSMSLHDSPIARLPIENSRYSQPRSWPSICGQPFNILPEFISSITPLASDCYEYLFFVEFTSVTLRLWSRMAGTDEVDDKVVSLPPVRYHRQAALARCRS
jgi:hypothetical protein